MAIITVDASLCTGCGLCASTYPELFDISDDNLAHVKGAPVDQDLNEITECCPVSAIQAKEV